MVGDWRRAGPLNARADTDPETAQPSLMDAEPVRT
jgi:hypothetical protein